MAQPTALALTAVATNAATILTLKCRLLLLETNYTYAAVKTTATAPTTLELNPMVVNTNSGTDLVWDV
jgi:hypothetical protein